MNDPGDTLASARFELPCACGAWMRGDGAPAPVRCLRCGAVLALDATDPKASAADSPLKDRTAKWRLPRFWNARSVVSRLVSWFTLPRAIALTMIAVLAITGWWTWDRYRFRAAKAELTRNWRDGSAAFDKGDFARAEALLRHADRAGQIVGRHVLLSRQARQLHSEAQVWLSLCPRPLDDFLVEALAGDPAEAVAAFDREFAGRTLVFDGTLTRKLVRAPASAKKDTPPHTPSSQYQMDWIWRTDAVEVRLVIGEQPVLAKLKLDEPHRVVFGARLEKLALVSPGDGQWQMRLAPVSVVLLTAATPLEQAHWPDDDTWRPILDEQRIALGIIP